MTTDNTLKLDPLPLLDEFNTDEYGKFMTQLVRRFRPELKELLVARQARQADPEYTPGFLADTAEIREGDWEVASIPADLQDRRCEITGPPDRKMTINALNSGARVFMADFEDSLSPTWWQLISGQVNLRDAVDGTISYKHPTKGTYQLRPDHAILFVRPRGLHLPEKHATVDDETVPGCLFDWGTYMFLNAKTLVQSGRQPYFYLPKLEHWHEAQWWNSVFAWGEEQLGLATGTARATVLIETLPAAFQMNEILWALRDHSVGLNCGRWDYIFSYIKCFSSDPQRVTPDRSLIGMNQTFMDTYSKLLVDTCHRRGTHAMGGMAAQIPSRDPVVNKTAFDKVKVDKTREVQNGHDGTWVAHPGLVELATEIFDNHLTGPNQTSYRNNLTDLDETKLTELLTRAPAVSITQAGLEQNVDVGVRYIAAWIKGLGCVPLYNLMEDAATAEISRTQVWQWVRHEAKDDLGEVITPERVEAELTKILNTDYGDAWNVHAAVDLFRQMYTAEKPPEFLTLSAYTRIRERE